MPEFYLRHIPKLKVHALDYTGSNQEEITELLRNFFDHAWTDRTMGSKLKIFTDQNPCVVVQQGDYLIIHTTPDGVIEIEPIARKTFHNLFTLISTKSIRYA